MSYPLIEDIKNHLSIASNTDDYLLALQLTQAIAIIESLTGRTFVSNSTSTKTFYTDNRSIVNNRKFVLYDDLCSITSLSINSSVIASNKYRVGDRTPYYAIELLPTCPYTFQNYSTNEDPSSFSITGNWSYSIECPRDIFGAIIRLSAWLYHKKDNAADYDRPVAFSNTLNLSRSLPSDVTEITSAYERFF